MQPEWYITPEEFADLVIDVSQEIGYFKRQERQHPEDISINFIVVAQSVAAGMGYAGKKIHKASLHNHYEHPDYSSPDCAACRANGCSYCGSKNHVAKECPDA